MSTNVIQTSFASGELAPSIAARTDLAKYKSGAATMRNFFVDYRSGASTRAGLEYIIHCLVPNKPVRLIPFQFSSNVSYMIEFGDFYCRFITDAGVVLETGVSITNTTLGSPASITAPGNTFNNGDVVYIEGIVGTTQLNNRYYEIATTGATVTLRDLNGSPVNALDYTAYVSGGTIAKVYQVASPYAAEDLFLLKFVQSASVMTFTHPDYVPYNLSAASPTDWVFTAITFGATTTAPTGVSASATAGSGAYYAFIVTTIDENGQESIASTVFNLNNVVNLGTTAGTITVTWNAMAGAQAYNVYKASLSVAGAVPVGAAFGFIGTATGTSFIDSNIVPDYSVSPPVAKTPFLANNPGCVCYFQQRLTFGGGLSYPTTFWMSQPGSFYNFNVSFPAQDDDSITGTIVSLQVNEIESLVPMPGGLIALTTKGAWQISGGAGQANSLAITPANATATPQAYNGVHTHVMPIVVNFDVLYIQAKGAIVRDLSYNIYANIYTGTDISILSNHLFFGYQIEEWAYAEEPYKIIWLVRSDGAMLSLTFVKEQEMIGWARHDTKGQFKSIATITEGQYDAIYVVVKRYLQGQWVQLIERMDNRAFTFCDTNPTGTPILAANAESAWCVDCGLQSPLPTPAAGLTADTNVGDVTFVADAGVFASTDVDSVIRMGGGNATITSYVSPTSVLGTWNSSPSVIIPNDPLKTPAPALAGEWSLTAPFDTFQGLDHLEGQTVSILADGGVITPQVVTDGSITLTNPATLVTVGLPYQAQLQTMYLDISSGAETIQGKRKKISALSVRANNARGLKAGRKFTDESLVQIKELSPETILGQPIPLVTGDERVIMDPLWDVPGQICLQQDDPLPATVLGVIPEISVGDTGEKK